jgi:cytoskeleton protein RodZ
LARTATLDEIVFIFSEECWLEVSDSRGDVLIADLQPAGGRLVLQGKAPFDVKLGNVPATQIELNNEKIAVVPALGTNVLSLKVGKSINE